MDDDIWALDKLTDAETTLVESFAKSHEEIELVSEYFQKIIYMLSENNMPNHVTIWNACQFINIISHDLSVLISDILYDRNSWKRRLLARNLALLLYEIGEDLPTVLGKDFRSSCKSLGVPNEMILAVSKQMKGINILSNDNQSELKTIRNIAGAHRDHNAFEMFELIKGISLQRWMLLGLEFGSNLNKLGGITQPILNFVLSQLEKNQLFITSKGG